MHGLSVRYRAALAALSLALVCSAAAAARAQAPAPGSVLISEIRFTGPAGHGDEFAEFYNNTDAPVTVRDASPPGTGQAGWAVVHSQRPGVVFFVIPEGTVIPARGHFLAVRKDDGSSAYNPGSYSLDAYPAGAATTATGDLTYAGNLYEAGGVALFNTANPAGFTLANRLDAVGQGAAGPLYVEGTPLRGVGLRRAEWSAYRDLSSGRPRDTNDNRADFIQVDQDTRYIAVGFSRLGAAGPENLSSPVVNPGVTVSLLDPSACAGCEPNRSRSVAPDPAHPQCSARGTLTFRRLITNNTAQPVTRLRLRVIDITTLGTPGYETGAQADLRVLSSAPGAALLTTGEPVAVAGSTLEQPPAQPNCGGYNSSLSVGAVTLAQPLAPGQSVAVQITTGVVRGGAARFFFQVESAP